jgi:DNA-binding response OmpR family regulator
VPVSSPGWAFRQVLADQIAVTGIFQATEAASLDEASRHFGVPMARFDSILLDIGLPDGDGRDFCAKLRKQGHTMPIIMLTGATMEGVPVEEVGRFPSFLAPRLLRFLAERL